jgi:hypothetical protein
MLSSPVGQLFGSDVTIPSSGEVFLCVYKLVAIVFNLGVDCLPTNKIIDEWSPRSVKTLPPRVNGEMRSKGMRIPDYLVRTSPFKACRIGKRDSPGPEKV